MCFAPEFKMKTMNMLYYTDLQQLFLTIKQCTDAKLKKKPKKLWNVNVTVKLIIVRALGTILTKKPAKETVGTGDSWKNRDYLDNSCVEVL